MGAGYSGDLAGGGLGSLRAACVILLSVGEGLWFYRRVHRERLLLLVGFGRHLFRLAGCYKTEACDEGDRDDGNEGQHG